MLFRRIGCAILLLHWSCSSRIDDQCCRLNQRQTNREKPRICRVRGWSCLAFFLVSKSIIVVIGIGIIADPIPVRVESFSRVIGKDIKEIHNAISVGVHRSCTRTSNDQQTKNVINDINERFRYRNTFHGTRCINSPNELRRIGLRDVNGAKA